MHIGTVSKGYVVRREVFGSLCLEDNPLRSKPKTRSISKASQATKALSEIGRTDTPSAVAGHDCSTADKATPNRVDNHLK